MNTRVRHIWDKLASSYWFIPAVMMVLAAALAFGLIYLDHRVIDGTRFQLVYAGDANGARDVLGTIAASIITVAGVVFSITISALTLASQQFGPRLLRSFMRDTGNQVVLGTFVSTFIYCLLVLRTVRGAEDPGKPEFVPQASVTVAVLFALASIAVLIYFIHHISQSLQAPQVIATAGRDLEQAIGRMFPGQLGRERDTPAPPPKLDDPQRNSTPVTAHCQGYVQAIDVDALMELAVKHDLLLCLMHRPGHWVINGSAVARVEPAGRIDESIKRQISDAFIFGSQRTAEQDVEHAMNQMVEIAARAMSPGINDPFTAITCVNWLADSLCRLGHCDLPGRFRYDDAGVLRVVTPASTFPGLVDAAFNQTRQFAVNSRMVAVIVRMLEVIGDLAAELNEPDQRQVLLRHAIMIHSDSLGVVSNEQDRADVLSRYEAAVKALGDGNVPSPE